MSVRILIGDAREKLRDLPEESVHCVVTSPPYWGLRCYGMDGQIGQEPTLQEHIEVMVEVFREVRRVLRKDGTVWLNYGDSYANHPGSAVNRNGLTGSLNEGRADFPVRQANLGHRQPMGHGLKPKDLCMMPARVALALQADGWWLRSEIIWHKPNPMPESVTDRPTSSHEKIYLLAKSQKYYFDAEAVREAAEYGRREQPEATWDRTGLKARSVAGTTRGSNPEAGRNIRNVWTVATAPFPGAHFATFPPALIEPCIKAGTSEKGCCPECGAPWVREVERNFLQSGPERNNITGQENMQGWEGTPRGSLNTKTLGWRPSCECNPLLDGGSPIPCTVLDPFSGAGTTGLVADRLKRNAILIELNPDYAAMAEKRIQADAGMFAEIAP